MGPRIAGETGLLELMQMLLGRKAEVGFPKSPHARHVGRSAHVEMRCQVTDFFSVVLCIFDVGPGVSLSTVFSRRKFLFFCARHQSLSDRYSEFVALLWRSPCIDRIECSHSDGALGAVRSGSS